MTRWSPLEEQLASLAGVTFNLDSGTGHLLRDEVKDGIHFYYSLFGVPNEYDRFADRLSGISTGRY